MVGWFVYLSYAKIGGFPWRHLDVRASRHPHTLTISIATTALLDPSTSPCVQICIAIQNLLKLIRYLKALYATRERRGAARKSADFCMR
jgi:hypothetical protein